MAGSRLGKDIQNLRRHIDAQTNGQAVVTEVDDNMEFLQLTLMPNDGFYKGAKLRFKLCFTDRYPEEVPQVTCLERVYHPNIVPYDEEPEDAEASNVCVSLLDEWEAGMDLDHMVMALLFLLYNPNPEDALSPYFDDCLDIDTLGRNIRRTLRGGHCEGTKWPRLLEDGVDDDDDDVDDNPDDDGDSGVAGSGGRTNPDDNEDSDGEDDDDDESDMETASSPDDQRAGGRGEVPRAGSGEERGGERLARPEGAGAAERKPPTAPGEKLAATTPTSALPVPLFADPGTSVDGQGSSDGQVVPDANASDDSLFSRLSPMPDSRHGSSSSSDITSGYTLADIFVTPVFKEVPVIRVDPASLDCKGSEGSKSFTDSLGIGRLFSCNSCTCRASGSGIKALFSCFRQRGAPVQLQTPSAGGVWDALGDCDVD